MISKEQLIDLYQIKRLTTYQISSQFNVDRTTVCFWLKKYNIPIIKAQRKYEEFKNTPLTDLQKEYIFGTLLGDGSIIKSGKITKSYHLNVGHCEKQLELLKFGYNILGNLVQQKIKKRLDTRTNKYFYSFNTIRHKEFKYFEELFYDNRIKVVREDFYNLLTPLSFCVWVMDDGSIDTQQRKSIYLHTECFTELENNLLKDMIFKKFNICSKVLVTKKKDGRIFYYIAFDKYNSTKLSNLIEPHMVDCMRYKLIKQ